MQTIFCIFTTASLRCDGEINCGFSDSDFGTDEENCSGGSGKSSEDFFSHDRPASLYIFAITCIVTLIVVLALVIVACCCIRKFANLRGHHPSNPHLSPSQDILEFHMATTNMSGYKLLQLTIQYTWPSFLYNLMIILCSFFRSNAHISLPERNEKLPEDLPPSYDALFPKPEPTKKQ